MINFESRLDKLKERRHGKFDTEYLTKLGLESYSPMYESLSNKQEIYESLQESSAIKYTIGAMSEVDSEYTKVSKLEGERVAETLKKLLKTEGKEVTFRMQGSVPLNIHIKGHSDVDMLIINHPTILYETPAVCSSYTPLADQTPMVDILKELRELCENKLTNRYHAAEVNCNNAKSIALEGGSLQRKVDIVPSCWLDTLEYQKVKEESVRGIEIYDKENHKLIGNSPFKHIKLVNYKDSIYNGNLKKVVRLLKNLIADMPYEKNRKSKKLSSFDLVSIVYHMDSLLICNEYTPLVLIDRLLTKLNEFVSNEQLRGSTKVPDGSRIIFDNQNKIEALYVVRDEIKALSDAIHKDITNDMSPYDPRVLQEKYIIPETLLFI